MHVDFLTWRRLAFAAAACLVGSSTGCSPVGWGVNEVKSLYHHQSFHPTAPTKALEEAATPQPGVTPRV